MRHQDVTPATRAPAPSPAPPRPLPRPALLPDDQPGGWPVTLTAGQALIALLAGLAARRLPATSSSMNLDRLRATVTLPGGVTVRCCCGWLAWPAGRPSRRGRPLHTLHPAHDPAGAARRLTRPASPGPPG